MIIKMNPKELEASSAATKDSQKVPVNISTVTATGKMEAVDGRECEIYLVKNLNSDGLQGALNCNCANPAL